MIRVLHIFHSMANGGIEAFVMNNYRRIDRTKIQFDFLVSVDTPGYYDDEILALGGKIYHAYPLKKNPVKNYLDISRIVRENHYQIVHRHTGSAFGYFDLRAARHGGASQLILHSHNPQAGKPLLHYFSKFLLQIKCERLACSQESGAFLFGQNKPFRVFPNAIDCDRFAFSESTRQQIRSQLSLENKFVIGHVGRFETQKNHKKLLDVFCQLHSMISESVLVCVGTGSLLSEMQAYAVQLGISKDVLFLGSRNDVDKVIQAFDAFCMPSLYEGFSLTLLELQANGLTGFVSKDVIPTASNVSGNLIYIPLDASCEQWATEIRWKRKPRDPGAAEKLKSAGYDLDVSSVLLQEYYFDLADRMEKT